MTEKPKGLQSLNRASHHLDHCLYGIFTFLGCMLQSLNRASHHLDVIVIGAP